MDPQALVLTIRLQPRASRNRMMLLPDGTLKVSVTAPPVEERANRELVRFLSTVLGVRPSSIAILSGIHGREKRVRINTDDPKAISHRLRGAVDKGERGGYF